MGEFEAAGELVTGGLLARAVEPHAGHGAAHGLCLNCGTALAGAHCYRCGQGAHIHRSFGAIFEEILHGVVHFEGKLWKTLPLLAWRPGELTRRYIRGERARFVSPMAMFLFSIFTLFAVFSIVGLQPPADLSPGTQELTNGVAAAQDKLQDARRELVKDRRDAADEPVRAAALSREIETLDKQIGALAKITPAPAKPKKSSGVYVDAKQGHTGWKRLDKGIEKARKNPSLMLYKLQANSYKFSWLLIPLSLPFVWLLFFWKREYKMYDHAVFVTYSIAFMSMLFIAITTLAAVGLGGGWLGLLAILIPPVHLYRQLRGAYQLGRVSAFVRMLVLSSFIHIVITLFVGILLLLGLAG